MTIWTAGVPHAQISFNSSSTADQTALASALGFISFDQTEIINYMINNDIEMTVIHDNGKPLTFKISSIHVPSENQFFEEGYTGIYLDPRPDTSALEGDFKITVKPLPWTDAGATADGNETVTASGTVDTSAAGTYTITYTATDAAGNVAIPVTRTVTVEDTTAPVITLAGAATETVEAGFPYTDAGAAAYDALDGDLSHAIEVINNVDTNVVGQYLVKFDCQDLSGNAAVEVTRTVLVVDSASDLYAAAAAAAGLTGGDADLLSRPFGGSTANLQKYAFNMNLGVRDSYKMTPGGISGLPSVQLVINEGDLFLRVEFVRRKNSGISYSVRKSTTLAAGSFVDMTGAETVTAIDADWERVVVAEPCDPSITPNLFCVVGVGLE
jgi:hypothetical protein